MTGNGEGITYSFEYNEEEEPIKVVATSDRSFGWLKTTLAQQHGEATASQVHIFQYGNVGIGEIREPLSQPLCQVLGKKRMWKVVFEGHVIGQQLSNSLDDVMVALDLAIPVQGPQGAQALDIGFLSKSNGACRSVLSKFVECYLTYKLGVLEEETIGIGKRITGSSAGSSARTMIQTGAQQTAHQIQTAAGSLLSSPNARDFLNFIQSTSPDRLPQMQGLLESFQRSKLRDLQSFFTSYGKQLKAGGDIIAGAANLAHACMQLVDAMNLREQCAKAYDEIVGFITQSLQAVVFGMRSLNVLTDRIWRLLTQQHADLDQINQRQVLSEKYEQICSKIVSSLQALEQWFISQEDALHGLKKLQDQEAKAATRSAIASGVATAFNVVTYCNAAGGLCKLAAGIGIATNGVSLAIDLVAVFKILPEAREKVDQALVLISVGKAVVVDTKGFLAKNQGWHTRDDIVREALVQEFRDKEKVLVDFLQDKFKHQVVVPTGGDAVQKAFQELTEVQARAIPVLNIRMGGA